MSVFHAHLFGSPENADWNEVMDFKTTVRSIVPTVLANLVPFEDPFTGN
jgi:hypothetical protein